jgi:hypothetical protein
MTRFTIYTYLFKPINEPQEPDMFSPLVKVEESLAMKQELLGELFLKESKLRFTKSRNNSDSEYKQFEHLMVSIQMDHHRQHLMERGVLPMSLTICVASTPRQRMIWTTTA